MTCERTRQSDKRGDALDCTGSGARAEPLAYVLSEILADQRHPVDTEGAEGGWGIEEPGDDLDIGRVVGGIDRMRGATPVLFVAGYVRSRWNAKRREGLFTSPQM